MYSIVRGPLNTMAAMACAGAIGLALVSPAPAPTELPQPLAVRSIAVHTMANPLDAYVQAIQHTFDSVGGLAQQALSPSPLPIASAVLANQIDYARAVGGGVSVAAGNLVDQLLRQLPAATGDAIREFLSGNPLAASVTVVNAASNFLLKTTGPIFGTVSATLSTAAFRLQQGIETALSPDVVTTLSLGFASPAYSLVLAAGRAAQNIVDAAGAGDLLGVIGQTIAAPAVVVDGFLNGIRIGTTAYGGLLSPYSFAVGTTGPLGALLYARNEIGFAMSPASAAPVGSSAAARSQEATAQDTTTSLSQASENAQELRQEPSDPLPTTQLKRQARSVASSTRIETARLPDGVDATRAGDADSLAATESTKPATTEAGGAAKQGGKKPLGEQSRHQVPSSTSKSGTSAPESKSPTESASSTGKKSSTHRESSSKE